MTLYADDALIGSHSGTPSKEEWLQNVRYVLFVKKLSAVNKFRLGDMNAGMQFHKTWDKFIKYWNRKKVGKMCHFGY